MLSNPQKGELSLENIEYFRKNTLENINQGLFNIGEYNKRKEFISKELLTLGEVKKLLIQLKNSKMFEKKDFILNTINTALADVFIDQNIKIDLVASNTNQEASKLNIKYDIVLFQNGVEMGRNDKMLTSNGGGVLSFISILFKILVGFIYSRNRLYIFDESLAQVSETYRPRMAQFIGKFCKKHSFDIIIITQTSDIAEFADLVYYLDGEFEDGIPILKIEKIVGDYPEENYIYSKIENFQSIKKLEFRYKGFTAIIGKNNIGKSASFRAINSILFNNFDMKSYPRMMSADKPEKQLNTRVEFGKFYTENDPRNEETKISFYKKGQSIIWNFNNMEFVGKNLAFDKVKEKIEEIGFRYLKLKDQYKNFKGNLKDQTERLAITTQHDDFYLVGGKTSETSKVFDFLFDSREVTVALIELNDDIKVLENELNSIVQITGETEFQISRARIELRKWDVLLKITLIRTLNQELSILEFNKAEKENILKELNLVNNILLLADLLWKVELVSKTNIETTNKINKLSKLVNIYTSLLNNFIKIDLLSQSISLSQYTKTLRIKQRLLVLHLQSLQINEVLIITNLIEQTKTSFNYFRTKFIVLEKLITNCTKRGLLEDLITLSENNYIVRNNINFLTKKSDLISKVLEKIKNIGIIKGLYDEVIKSNNYLITISKSINYNQLCLSFYNKNISLLNLKILLNEIDKEYNNIQSRKIHIQNLSQTLVNLPKAFNLKPCSVCETLGFTHEGH